MDNRNPFINGPAVRLNSCLACGGDKLQKYLDLGCQPLANNLSYTPIGALTKYPLEANFCTACAHSQLSVLINPRVLFRGYRYVSGTTETLKKHFMGLAVDAVNTFEEDHNLMTDETIEVLDIGCNDGTLLEQFRHLGCDVVGIDPAETPVKECVNKNIRIFLKAWHEYIDLQKKFDIITACNVFAHNFNPVGFLKAIKKHLIPGGMAVIEFPYSLKTFQEAQGDQFYHEHANYFNVSSFGTVALRAGLYIRKILVTPIHGGSIRFYLKEGLGEHCKEAESFLDNEGNCGLFDLKTYENFASRFTSNVLEFGDALNKESYTVGYAASAKATVVTNFYHLRRGYLPKIDYFVDDNHLKQGCYVPGTNIMIKHPTVLKTCPESALIACFAWNFMDEIKSRLPKDFRVITYVPNVHYR